jgi:hypothetical protein
VWSRAAPPSAVGAHTPRGPLPFPTSKVASFSCSGRGAPNVSLAMLQSCPRRASLAACRELTLEAQWGDVHRAGGGGPTAGISREAVSSDFRGESTSAMQGEPTAAAPPASASMAD